MKHRLTIEFDDETGDIKMMPPKNLQVATFMLGQGVIGLSQLVPKPNDHGLVLATPKTPFDATPS